MFKNKVDRESYLRLAWLSFAIIISLYVLFIVPGLITPILISIIVSYIFYPIINYIGRKQVARWISILVVYLLLGFSLVLVYRYSLGKLLTQFKAMQTDFPRIFASVIERLKHLETVYLSNYIFLEKFNLIENIRNVVVNATQNVFTSIPKLVSAFLSTALLVPFYTFFILKDGAKFKRWLFNQLPNRYFESGVKLIHDINTEMGGFIRARLLEAFIVGFIVGVGLSLIKLKYFIILSIFVGVMNLIPYVGPFIGAIPGLFVAFYYYGFDGNFLLVFLLYLFAQLVDIFFVIPVVFSRIVKVHPVMVVILILVGSYAYGIVGMILAVPVFSVLKSVYHAIYSRVVVNRL